MITTPEQMREAAALEADRIENSYLATIIRAIPIAPQPDYHTVSVRADTVTRVCGICDIADCETHRPTPQPVAVTVKPLVWTGGAILVATGPDIQTIGHSIPADMQVEYDAERTARILSALTIQPSDPLSDPRVVALVEAASRFPDGRQPWPPKRIRAAILALLATPLSPTAVDDSIAPDAGTKGQDQ